VPMSFKKNSVSTKVIWKMAVTSDTCNMYKCIYILLLTSVGKKGTFILNRSWRQRGGWDLELYYFFNLGPRWGWVVNATFRQLYPREWRDTQFTEGWMVPRDGLKEPGKSRPRPFSIPWSSN
jgi:hypothetical protein